MKLKNHNKYIKVITSAVSLLLMSVLLLTACTEAEVPDAVYYTVTFNSNGGTPVDAKQTEAGKLVPEPPTPEKEGYIFDGWYHNGKKWGFDYHKVSGDMTLDAMWLSPENVFEHVPTGDGETTTITKLKKKTTKIDVPTAIAGYKVTAIGDSVFKNLSEEEIYTITVPETVTSIGEECFMSSGNVNIIIKGELLHVGEKAFYDCDGLKSVTLGEGMETVTAEAFLGCTSLKSIRIPKSVKYIGENAFDSCTSLQSVMLYSDVIAVENMAFSESGIKVIYLYGTEEDADALMDSKVDAGNDPFLDATVLLYSEEEPTNTTEYGGYWYLDDNGQVRKW